MTFDRGIPLPSLEKAPHPAFRRMAVGDSVFVPHDGPITKCRAYLQAATIQKRSDAFRFAGRSVEENGVRGVRIWRV